MLLFFLIARIQLYTICHYSSSKRVCKGVAEVTNTKMSFNLGVLVTFGACSGSKTMQVKTDTNNLSISVRMYCKTLVMQQYLHITYQRKINQNRKLMECKSFEWVKSMQSQFIVGCTEMNSYYHHPVHHSGTDLHLKKCIDLNAWSKMKFETQAA